MTNSGYDFENTGHTKMCYSEMSRRLLLVLVLVDCGKRGTKITSLKNAKQDIFYFHVSLFSVKEFD